MIPPDDRTVGGATLYIRNYEVHRSAQPLAWSPKYYLSSLLPRRCCRCPAGVLLAAVPLPPARRRRCCCCPAAAPPLPCLEARWSWCWLSPLGTCCDSLSKHRSSMQTSYGMKGRAEAEREGTGGCPDPEDAERRCVKIKKVIQDSYNVIGAYCTSLK